MGRFHPAIFSGILFAFQVVLLILFATLADYGTYLDPALEEGKQVAPSESNALPYYYPMFQDVHVMIFIGFGFLMTFLKKYGYGAVGYNLFIAALIIQWATLVNAWFEHAFAGEGGVAHVSIDVKTLITSDFAAAAVLITFGAVLGKVSRLQLFLIGVIEIIFYSLNEKILAFHLKISDVGGSMVIHAFGAYFGLTVARILWREELESENKKEGSTSTSDLFSMIGTVFLWMFWPSFNGGLLGPSTQQNRAVVNTYFSLAACCIMTFVLSPLVHKKYKLNMVHVQNATLAGGVAVGAMADMVLKPWGAILVGMVAGSLSVLGFAYVTPFLSGRMKLHDTCGVNNLHGMPGLMAGIGAGIAAAVAQLPQYGNDLFSIWGARAPPVGTPAYARLSANFTVPEGGDGRTAGAQAGYQIAAVFVTLGVAIVGGLITGFIVKYIDSPGKSSLFDDDEYWEVPIEATDEERVPFNADTAEQKV